MSNDYKVIRKFKLQDKIFLVIRLKSGAAHIMEEYEWRKIYGRLHPERWKQK